MAYPFRPSPWEVASALHGWSGRRGDLGHIIPNDDIRIIHGPQTVDNIHRVELTPRLAMTNRKVFGFVAEINESDQMMNTETKYRFQVIAQLAYYHDAAERDDSWMWVRTNAFSSNALITDPVGIMVGAIVYGILTPTFGTHMTTQLESWDVSSCEEWYLNGLGGVPDPRNFDIDPETLDHLPVLGGSAFDLARLKYALAGARLRPP